MLDLPKRGGGVRSQRVWAFAAAAALTFLLVGADRAAAYVGQTEPPTNVMDDAVDLQGKVSWAKGEAGQYWFEYRPTVASPWIRASLRPFGPMSSAATNVSVTEKLRFSCQDVDGPCTGVRPDDPRRPLEPGSGYVYRFCRYVTAPASVNSQCFDSAGAVGGTNYDTFSTLQRWDDTSHATGACPPASGSAGSSWTCYDPEPSTLSHSPYAAHYTNTANYGIFGAPRWGAWISTRDLVFNGRQGRLWQSGDVIEGPGVRYDFRMKIYRGEGHATVADSYREIEPDTGFATSTIVSPTWFVFHRGQQYHVHYRTHFRANGRSNPSSPDGIWRTPVTATPYYYCSGSGEDNDCHFPD